MAKIAQRRRRVARHHHRRVVPGHVFHAARAATARIVFPVFARVPAVGGHVDAAAHRQRIVQHHDFLVVAAPDRMRGVEFEMDAAMRRPAQQVDRHRTARDEFGNAIAPFQDTDFQRGPVAREPQDEAAQARGICAFAPLLPPAAPCLQMDAGVEIPPDHQHPVPRFQHRLLHMAEIIFGIDDNGCAIRHLVTPHAGFDRYVGIRASAVVLRIWVVGAHSRACCFTRRGHPGPVPFSLSHYRGQSSHSIEPETARAASGIGDGP